MSKSKSKALLSKKDYKKDTRKLSGMSHWSTSHNSGYDDNFLLKPKGKGTYKNPYRYD